MTCPRSTPVGVPDVKAETTPALKKTDLWQNALRILNLQAQLFKPGYVLLSPVDNIITWLLLPPVHLVGDLVVSAITNHH
jgi:hypothetical protein